MSGIRLLAFDIDGTLSPPGEPVSAEVLAALRECVSAGIVLVPATGRKFSSIRKLCREIGITGPAITCNGSLTMNAETERVGSAHFLTRDLYEDIIRLVGRDDRFSLAVFTDTDIVCTDTHFASRALEAIGEPTSRFTGSLEALAGEKVAKVLAATQEESSLQSGYEEYARVLGMRCSVTTTSRQFLEFMAHGVSKGAALAEIASQRGIRKEEIACIGDSDNDLSLFGVSGHGFAVADATQQVLQAATTIVRSAAEKGVACAVRDHVLKKQPGQTLDG